MNDDANTPQNDPNAAQPNGAEIPGGAQVAAFDPEAAHQTKPRLRRIQPIPLQQDGKQLLGLRDATQISQRTVVTTPLAQFALAHMNGENDLEAIVSRAREQATAAKVPEQAVGSIERAPIEQLIAQLDAAGMIEGPVFDSINEELREQFDKSDILPPSATADFADALAKQELGEDASAEQMEEVGQTKLRELLDTFMEKALEKAENPSFDALPKAIVAPYIDYGRGWMNYGAVYGRLRVVDRPERVIVLGVNHFGQATGVTGCDKGYETPLGVSQLDKEFLDLLKAELGEEDYGKFMRERFDHEREGSIELQLPWIQHTMKDPNTGESPKVVGVLIHDVLRNHTNGYDNTGLALEPFVKAIHGAIESAPGKTLIVIAANLSHVGPAFGDKVKLAGEDKDATEARNRVLNHDKTMLDMVINNKPNDLITSMMWQKNPTRWGSIGTMIAGMRLADSDNTQMLNYAGIGDQQGMSFVTTCAMAMF